MTEFQELTKDAPKFDSMERSELVAYAYGMYAAGAKTDAENAKLRELVRDMFYAVHPADREKFLTNVAELGVEVDG